MYFFQGMLLLFYKIQLWGHHLEKFFFLQQHVLIKDTMRSWSKIYENIIEYMALEKPEEQVNQEERNDGDPFCFRKLKVDEV